MKKFSIICLLPVFTLYLKSDLKHETIEKEKQKVLATNLVHMIRQVDYYQEVVRILKDEGDVCKLVNHRYIFDGRCLTSNPMQYGFTCAVCGTTTISFDNSVILKNQ